MLSIIVINIIFQQAIKIKAMNYFKKEKITTTINEFTVNKKSYFDIESKIIYGKEINEEKRIKEFYDPESILRNLIKVNEKEKKVILFYNKQKISIDNYLKKYNQLIFKKQKTLNFISGKGTIYDYYSIFLDDYNNIIARFDWRECKGKGFEISGKKEIEKWFKNNENKILISKKITEKVIVDFILKELKAIGLNIEKNKIKVYFKNKNWKITLYGIKRFISKKGKLEPINNMKTYNYSLSPSKYDCSHIRFLIYSE